MDALKQVALQTGDFETLERLAASLAEIHRRNDDLWLLQFAVVEVAYADLARVRLDRAFVGLEESLSINRRIGDIGNEPMYLAILGRAHRARGNYDDALTVGRRAFDLARRAGTRRVDRVGGGVARLDLGRARRVRRGGRVAGGGRRGGRPVGRRPPSRAMPGDGGVGRGAARRARSGGRARRARRVDPRPDPRSAAECLGRWVRRLCGRGAAPTRGGGGGACRAARRPDRSPHVGSCGWSDGDGGRLARARGGGAPSRGFGERGRGGGRCPGGGAPHRSSDRLASTPIVAGAFRATRRRDAGHLARRAGRPRGCASRRADP